MNTESQSTNPFLISHDSSQFNPFHVNTTTSSNPFLQQITAKDSAPQYINYSSESNNSGTNPFAEFFTGQVKSTNVYSVAGGIGDVIDNATNDLRDDSTKLNSYIGGANEQASVSSSVHDQVADLLGNEQESTSSLFSSLTGGAPPGVDFFQSTTMATSKNADQDRNLKDKKTSPPSRPPPPRSVPAKATKDLILSVTGALEATSSDLLDRLQATRTPSPTPLRELNSPSPIMALEVNDLLGDDIEMPQFSHGEATHHPKMDIQQEALNIFDAIANLSREKETNIQAAATPPSRPPPPQLPIQCESDISNLFGDATRITSSEPLPNARTEDKTERGSRKTSLISGQSSRKNSSEWPPAAIATARGEPSTLHFPEIADDYVAADPFKLSDNYVPARKTSHDMSTARVQTIPTHKKYSLDYSSSSFGNQNIIKPSQFEQYAEAESDRNLPILETFKFPAISGTPIIISTENIDDENLYDAYDRRTSLVFEESVGQIDSFVDTGDRSNESVVPNLSQPDLFSVENDIKPKDDFDMFKEKFENFNQDQQRKSRDPFDPFGVSSETSAVQTQDGHSIEGFGNEDTFDEYLAKTRSQLTFTENLEQNTGFSESWFEKDQKKSPITNKSDDFKSSHFPEELAINNVFTSSAYTPPINKTDSTETPPTPLFDEDVSQPLEPFPRLDYDGPGWEMQIRYPIRKKFTGQRFWKKVFVRLVYQAETPHLELVNKDDGKETLHHEWPLQPCYAISDIGAQQYDQYGKIFTVKIQFVVYKERPGVRPGQVTKAERLTNKLSQFAAYAIQGDYQGVKEFGSDLKKLGLPVEHSPQISLICKLGSHNYEHMKQFSACIEDALFRLPAHRDNININYKMEEVQITAVDELHVEQNAAGSVVKQIARVRLFFLGFFTGMPDVEIGVNDLLRQGKEVVGRHDIIPVVTEEWIRLEDVEFHSCVQQDVYGEVRTIKLKPPDACYLELMRFRVRPPKNRELPLQLKTVFRICGNKVDIYADILVPGFTSRKLGQIPCEDVAIRIPIPECWIYLFRVEKHFRYGSVKSAHRRTGKIKGIERFLGAVDTLESHLIEVTSGHAKYEHHHRAIVWRMSRLPKEGQGAYTTHNLVSHLALTSYDQVPDELPKYCFVEFTMPVTQVSHTTVRSVSISNSDSDSPPEKYVRHLARHEYKVEIECTHSESTSDYVAATMTQPRNTAEVRPSAPPPSKNRESADSDSESD